jgi:hypothetical protein
MEEKNNFWKSALNYGAILGFSLIIFSLIIYFLDLTYASGVNWVSYIILVAGIILILKNYRDKQLNGIMSYSRGLGMGTAVSVVAAFIVAIYLFILFKYIDPDLIEQAMRIQEEKMLEKGMPEDQIEMASDMGRKFTTPIMTSVFGFLGNAIMGFIISLIAAAFIKKEGDGYSNAMKDVG